MVTSHGTNDLEAKLETIGNSLETHGFCIVETGDTQISSLLALASQFGRLQLHARADDRGMVEVSPNANLGKAAGKLSPVSTRVPVTGNSTPTPMGPI